MKSRTCETYCAEAVFQIQHSICAFNFPNNISRWGGTWHDLWIILIVNLTEQSFHNFINWPGPYFQVYISPLLEKIFRFTAVRLLRNVFDKLSLPLAMTWSLVPPCTKPPNKLANKTFLAPTETFVLEKCSPIHFWLLEDRSLSF